MIFLCNCLRYRIGPREVPEIADEIKEDYNMDETFVSGMEKISLRN